MLVAGAAMVSHATVQWQLQGKTYNVDTLFHAKIGPGTTQTTLQLGGAQKLKIFYTTTDLTDEYVDLRVTKGNNKPVGVQTLSTMCRTNSREGAQYFAGVNADFFGNSAPCGPCVVDGKAVCVMDNEWVSWYMNDKKQTGIGKLGFGGELKAGTLTHHVHGINKYRDENQIILFTPYYGATTGTNMYGAEVGVMPVEGQLSFNGAMKVKVVTGPATEGSMAIPAGGFVISGHGTGKDFVMSLAAGQELELSTSTALNVGGEITQLASGNPIILSGGKTLDTQGALDHLTALNPRTAIGYNEDKTKVVLLVVDGRTGISVGVVSKVLADIMREVGCSEAMNFDGGGSSELYTQVFGITNAPSGGSERPVTNAVWAVATSPTDTQISQIEFMNPRMTLPKYGYYKPVIYGYNKYGVLVSTNVEGYVLSCDPGLGHVVEGGSTLFADGAGSHVLTATYGDAQAQIVVGIGSAQPRMRLEKAIVDSYRDYKAEVVADVNGTEMAIENTALDWSTSDADVASVDDNGLVKGVSQGLATVTGKINDLVVTLPVSVEIPEKRYLPINKAEGITGWILSGSSTKNRSLEALEDDGVAINYTVSSARNASVTIKQVTELKALPDSMRIVVNPGDQPVTSIMFNAGHSGERATQVTYTPTLQANQDNVLTVPVSDFIDVDDMANYPFAFNSVKFMLGGAVNAQGRVEVRRLDGVYTAVKNVQGVENILADKDEAAKALLSKGSCVRGEILTLNAGEDAHWAVFTTAGRCLCSGHGNRVPTTDLSSDLYIVMATEGQVARSGKLLVR